MTQRCDYSDLPTNTCNHCHPEPRPGTGLPTTAQPTSTHGRVVHPIAYQEPTPTTAPVDLGSNTDALLTLHDYVTELTEPTTQLTPYTRLITNRDGSSTTVTEQHRTRSVPLLEQLGSAAEQSGSVESGQRVFASKPSASVEALDSFMRIEQETYTWLRRLGTVDARDSHPNLVDAIRHLRSLAASDDCGRLRGRHEKGGAWCCRRHDIELDVRSWWVQARTLTGWDQPAWRPANSCPICEVTGGLRVRRDASGAVCVECHTTWDVSSIGLLAEHIRSENHEDDDDTLAAGCG